jgi:universal stress protein A
MKLKFRKILCPIDFDRISIPAIEIAIEVARQNNGTIYLLCVVPKDRTSLKPDLDDVAHQSLLGVARKWLDPEIPYEILVRAGTPAKAVLDAQEELGIDLVVMATHGRTGINRLRLGSVTEEVVRRSTRPVMTIRPT